MSYREEIPANLLTRYDEHGLHGVKTRLHAGLYGGNKKKFAPVYIAGREEELREEANAEGGERLEREEDRAEAALSIAADVARISRKQLIVAIIATIAAIVAATASAIAAYITWALE